jgi:hypothetical protein
MQFSNQHFTISSAMTQSLLNKAAANPRFMFLIDGFGAVLTAFLSGVVLVRFEEFFGMPSNIMSILAIIACAFAAYSFTCAALNRVYSE